MADDPHSETSPAAADVSALFLYSRLMFRSDRVGVTKDDLPAKEFLDCNDSQTIINANVSI